MPDRARVSAGGHVLTWAADVWTVPADGTGEAKLFIPDAESPAALWN
ncbi:hypothetical protein COUCH_27420 [Couchioplanes caeruleus]|nr:hypothetical protein [Couchioplanes caeruleus]UQU62747.1 hypothetical protein COUCH_27420 [Couchioplanes caeruleus]